MSAWILWCCAVWGLSSLACSMSKHQRDIFVQHVTPQQTRLFQVVGWSLLIILAVVMISVRGASIGLSQWIGCLSFAALIVGLTLTYFPKKLKQLNLGVLVLWLLLVIWAVSM